MAFTFADADRLDELASSLDRRGEQVRVLGDELVRRAAEALWTSIAADAFRQQVSRRSDYCSQVSDRLHRAAHEMRCHAQAVRDEIAALHAIEESVRGFLSAAASATAHVATAAASATVHAAAGAVSTAGQVASAVAEVTWVPIVLPPSGDEAWRDIARLGRLAGAPI